MTSLSIKVNGKNTVQKKAMIDFFKSNSEKVFKQNNNTFFISIENTIIRIESIDKLQKIKLNKPVSVNDLLKAIYNINSIKINNSVFSIQHIIIDTKNFVAIDDKKYIDLTEKEIQIIICLYNANNNKLTKNRLLSSIWGYSDNIDTHTLESHIYKLRKKIELDPKNPKIIITDKGSYKLIV